MSSACNFKTLCVYCVEPGFIWDTMLVPIEILGYDLVTSIPKVLRKSHGDRNRDQEI